MNYRPEISTDGGKTFGRNAQVFATEEEAMRMARDIFTRWTSATDYRIAETTDPANYRFDGDELTGVTESEGGERD